MKTADTSAYSCRILLMFVHTECISSPLPSPFSLASPVKIAFSSPPSRAACEPASPETRNSTKPLGRSIEPDEADVTDIWQSKQVIEIIYHLPMVK